MLMIRAYRNWICALRNRLGRRTRPGDVVYELRAGVRFNMESGRHDVRVLNEIWLDRIYERIGDFRVCDGWTVVDLGAHKGAFTVRAALAGPRTIVHAVEPAPANLSCLRTNLQLNRIANVHVHDVAVGRARGRAVLAFETADSGRGSLVAARGHSQHMVVDTVTLEELLVDVDGPVDLLKIDVEGAEYDVLRSMPEQALSSVRRVVLEYHAVEDRTAEQVLRELRSVLEREHFRCVEARDRSLLFAARPNGGGIAP